MNMTRLSTLIALLALALMIAVPAVAQDYPIDDDEEPSATASQTVIAAGGTVTVEGDGWLPGSEVTISIFGNGVSEVLGTAQVNAAGEFVTQVTIPSNLAPGAYSIRITGLDTDAQPRTVDIPITVTGAAAGAPAAPVTPGTALARTGGYLTTAGSMAVLLLVIGGGALFASRRLGKVAA
jgi:energy-converting hydrogenase Eha subunit A